VLLRRDGDWFARAENIGRGSTGVTKRFPAGWIRDIRLDAVGVVRKVDRLMWLVVEGDVEVLSEDQLAHRRVNRPVKLLEVARSARCFGDPIEGRLDALRSLVLRLARLELGDPGAKGVGVRRHGRLTS
jgi:hypothetical protein